MEMTFEKLALKGGDTELWNRGETFMVGFGFQDVKVLGKQSINGKYLVGRGMTEYRKENHGQYEAPEEGKGKRTDYTAQTENAFT